MMKKIYYSSMLLCNWNNIVCDDQKVKLIKYVVNNKVFTGGNNFIFKKGELKIKDIIDIENVRKKAGKNYLPNNKLCDLSTPDAHNESFTYSEELVNKMISNSNEKLKLIKVEKIKRTKENTGGTETIKEEKTEYNEGNGHIKKGTLANQEEVIENDADYIFYYNYEVTFPANSLHIMYNNVEYTNKNEIKLDCNLDEKLNNIENFFNQVKGNVFDKNGKKLTDELNKKTAPIHVLGYNMNYNIDCCNDGFMGENTFYELLLSNYNEKTFVSLYLKIDVFYKYKIVLKSIKGYNFRDDDKVKDVKIRTKLNEHQDQQFTEDSLNDFIKKDLFLKDGYYNLTFKTKLEKDKKINEDNEITLEFDIDKIKKDKDSQQFISTYLKEKQYVYKYSITNTPSGYKLKSDILKNADENEFFKGKLSTIEEIKGKIKGDLGLENEEYTLENLTDIEKDFNNDPANILIKIKLKDADKLKDKMFEKIPQENKNKQGSGSGDGSGNGTSNGNKNNESCCGSNGN